MKPVRIVIALALTAAAVRLLPLHLLHPVNWDEIEFYRATKWIAEGRLPFRDFWEHHSPLPWFLFAPVARFVRSIDTSAIVAMRWAQVPVWIAIFILANVFMRNAGLSRFARWAAMGVAVTSSLLMTSAVEYRVDPVAIALLFGGLVLAQRGTARAMFGAGALFCLTGMSNLRLGPMLVAGVLLIWLMRKRKAMWIAAGGVVTLAIVLLFFVATHSLAPMWQQLIVENKVGEATAPGVEHALVNRIAILFGVHVIVDRPFDLSLVDPGGIAIVVLGLIGLVVALQRWRTPDDLFLIAVLQLVNLVFYLRMKYVFNYHFQIVTMLAVPVIALVFERIKRREAVIALLAVTWCVNAYASVLRGKENDRAYQDLTMREAHARTKPGETVFAGMPWALDREPAYRFWFLPELARQLVMHRHAAPYAPMAQPPAAFIADRSTLVWLTLVQPELGPYFVRHYTPVWRSVWIPGMNAAFAPGARQTWTVPRDGEYRLYVLPDAARHPWFTRPIYVSSYDVPGVEIRLPEPGNHPALRWNIEMTPLVRLRKGQRIEATSREALAVFLLSSDDRTIFRQPPKDVTLEAAAPRVTHWPFR
jgi:hypothetical protein